MVIKKRDEVWQFGRVPELKVGSCFSTGGCEEKSCGIFAGQ
jgi:hypothetical protein